MKDIVRRNLKEDYKMLVDVEVALMSVKKHEKDTRCYVMIAEQIDKIKCVEHNLLQMMIACLESDQTLTDLFLKDFPYD